MQQNTLDRINDLMMYCLELANESRYQQDYEEVEHLVEEIKGCLDDEKVLYQVDMPATILDTVKSKLLPLELQFGWLKPRVIRLYLKHWELAE